MKKVLATVVLLSCIVSCMFALSAKIQCGVHSGYRTIIVYDDNKTKVLEYKRPPVSILTKKPLGSLYAISWYKDGATAEQIKEWKEFAKIFVEEDN